MHAHEYLVEMDFTPFATLLTPKESASFTENMALPTLEALEGFAKSGRIRAGGARLAAGGFSFIAEATSPQDLEEMVTSLPLWPRAQVRVVALAPFSGRTASMRGRLAEAKARAAQKPRGKAKP
jgi:hypothetical protein